MTPSDDGYSGTTFDRPGVKRLLEDAGSKRINTILVKDLSRFGRNYIEFGQYTDYLFPAIGCRFIALNNGIDTQNEGGSNDIMCFLNLFNEFYSRDTSRKVKAVKTACAQEGKFMGTYPAYGYRRDPLNKHHLLIDEETASVVRQMFALRCQGTGFRKIACILNEAGVTPPGVLYYQRKGETDPRRVNHQWAETTVKAILCNEVYIGNMVQGKYGTVSYKDRRLVAKPEDMWIRVKGTHEPVIARETWNMAAEIGRKKVRKSDRADGERRGSIFTGLLYCAGCGHKLRVHHENRRYKDGSIKVYTSFICSNYARSGRTACSIHRIDEDVLKELVLGDIKERTERVKYDEAGILKQITRLKEKTSRSCLTSAEHELKETAGRVGKLEKLIQSLYEDRCAGTVSQEVFQTLIDKYEAEWKKKKDMLLKLEQKARRPDERESLSDAGEALKKYISLDELDESILFELIDRIEIGERIQIEKKLVQDIRIVYRFGGNFTFPGNACS